MAAARSPQWPLSVPCLASGGVTVLNNLHWPIDLISSFLSLLRTKKESRTSSRPSGQRQRRQMLKTFQRSEAS